MPRVARLLWPIGIAVGLASEWVAFGWSDAREWIPDLAVGWAFLACGLVVWSQRPESRTGVLMVLTGFAWFAGNFAPALIYLHRGPLIHCVLAYPTGRLRSRIDRVTVATAYAVALVPALGRSEVATIVLAVALVAVAFRGYLSAVGAERRARLTCLQAASAVALVLAGPALARLVFPAGDATEAGLLAYEAGLVIVAAGALAGLLRGPWLRAPVADLVVELGDVTSGPLRDALARALGDPTLQVGYWLDGGYIDAEGARVELPGPGSRRAVTLVERDGRPLAALVHDPAVLDDSGLVEGIAAAARLAAANARLQADVRAQLAELAASRRRIVEAGDDERRRLEMRLREGTVRRLEALGEALAAARAGAGPASGTRLDQAQGQLARALADLRELALGLHPRDLVDEGLEGALTGLAARSAVPVDLDVAPVAVPRAAEAAAYFLCSEALTNVAKYASASRVAISVDRRNGHLAVDVADDGVGGADPARGSGLRGLEDRVEALGGTLRVDSRPGGGTHLRAVIPIADDRTVAA